MFKNTKKLALAATLSLAAFSANATIINFAAMGNDLSPPNPDQGGYQPLSISLGNVNLTIRGYDNQQETYAYLDSNTGGLGVCPEIDSNKQCVPRSDDNVRSGEYLTFSFTKAGTASAVNINSISFNNNHDGGFWKGNLININGIAVDVGSPSGYRVTHTVNNPFSNPVSSFTVAFNNREFYVESINVPEPSIIALLGLGLIGVGALTFSRKAVKRS